MRSLTRPKRWQLLLVCAFIIGVAEPYLEIAWKCRAGMETSEACVWGRSFLSLGKWVAPVFITPVAFLVLLFAAACVDWLRGRRR
jgi:hypothetical protein